MCECVFLVCGVISSLAASESHGGKQRTLEGIYLKGAAHCSLTLGNNKHCGGSTTERRNEMRDLKLS